MFRIHSLRMKTILLLLLLQIPLILLFVSVLYYIVSTNNNRFLDTVSGAASSQIQVINDSMTDIHTTVQLFNAKTPLLPQEEDPSSWYFYYKNLQKNLDILETGTSQAHSALAYYFIYNRASSYFLKSSLHRLDAYDLIDFHDYLSTETEIPSYIWQRISLHQSNYFLYIIYQGDYIIGALVNCDDILNSFYRASTQDAEFLMIDEKNQCIASHPDAEKLFPPQRILEIQTSAEGELAAGSCYMQRFKGSYGFTILSAVYPPSFWSILSGNPLTLVVILYFLISIPALTLFLWKQFLAPVNYILFGFSQIESGNLDYRAQEHIFSSEFRMLNYSFNAMVRQIKELRMDYYEEKILQQEAENRYLRAISYPHFLLNNLNLINNFAYQHNEEGIHEAVLNLSAYLRYFVTASANTHTLANDVRSAECYLNLNQLAYPDRITYHLDYEEELLDLKFPPLIVSTIVENCIKHGLTPGDSLNIALSLSTEQRDDQTIMKLRIHNTGPCFPADVLKLINDSDIQSQITDHVGLLSVRQTLFHVFGSNAKFTIENQSDGPVTQISVTMASILQYQKGVQEHEPHTH